MSDENDTENVENLTADQAKARIEELKKDSKFAAKYADGKKKAVAKMTRLHEIAFAGGQKVMGKG